MHSKIMIFMAVMLIFMLIPVSMAASPSVTITYTQHSVNSYLVTFNDSQKMNVTINVLNNGVFDTSFVINSTMTKLYNITQNTTFVAIVNNQQITSVTLVYTYVVPELNIVLLSNATYQIGYTVPSMAYLLVYDSNHTQLMNRSINNSGVAYMSPQLSPALAIITYRGNTEAIMNFPVVSSRNVTNIINKYYPGVPIQYVVLMAVIIGIADMIGMFFIYNGRAQVKKKIWTNKDDTLIDRFKTQQMSNVEYTDPNLLAFLTGKFTVLDGLLKRAEELEKKYNKLVEQEQNRRGGE